MMGRLAPGANVVPAMPGLYWRLSVRVAPGVAVISRAVTIVSGTKASGAMNVRDGMSAGGVVGNCVAAGPWAGAAAGRGATTGLGVVTTTPGSWVCAMAANPPDAPTSAANARVLTLRHKMRPLPVMACSP